MKELIKNGTTTLTAFQIVVVSIIIFTFVSLTFPTCKSQFITNDEIPIDAYIELNWTKETSGTIYTQYDPRFGLEIAGWADGQGNIILNQSFKVSTGTLRISAGVNIFCNGSGYPASFLISKDIIAQGTADEPITFSNTGYSTIDFQAYAGMNTQFNYCDINGFPIGIQNRGRPVFSNSTLNNTAIEIYGSDARPEFQKCHIENMAFLAENGADPKIIRSTINNSKFSFRGCSPLVTHNSFNNCEISITEDFRGSYADNPSRPIISNNLISSANVGLNCVDHSILQLDNNSINECNIGVQLEGEIIASLIGNQISNCNTGVSFNLNVHCTLRDNILTRNMNGTIFKNNGNILLENNTIFNNTYYGILAFDRELPNITNNTFEIMGIQNNEGIACQYWKLNVIITNQKGRNLYDYSLNIQDIFGNNYGVFVREYIITNNGDTISYNPYSIEATYKSFNNYTEGLFVNNSTDITLIISTNTQLNNLIIPGSLICIIFLSLIIYLFLQKKKRGTN